MPNGSSERTPSPPVVRAVPPLRLRSLVAGQVFVREGDPPGPLYVICAGTVRVYRRDPTAVGSIVELACLGVGDVIGELAAILGQMRSASVQALEATQVLEIPLDALPDLAPQHQPLLRVVALAVRERTAFSDLQIARSAARLGLTLPTDVMAGVDPATQRTQAVPIAHQDPAGVYPRVVKCPSCGTRFSDAQGVSDQRVT